MLEKLRIGILIDDFEVPAWTYQMLLRVYEIETSEIVLLVKNKAFQKKEEGKNINFPFSQHYFYSLYKKFDRKYFRSSPDAFEPREVNFLSDIPVIEVEPKQEDGCQHFDKIAVDTIKKYKIDLFVKLGFKELKGDILKVSRFGIWSYHHGNIKYNRGEPPGFWEVFEKRDEVGSTLQMITENDNRKILFRSSSLTDKISVERNLNNSYWKAASFIPRKINDLARLGATEFFLRVEKSNQHPDFYFREIKSIPSNKESLVNLIKFKWGRFKNVIRAFFYRDQWLILYHLDPSGKISTNLSQFKKIVPPKDRFWADPHIAEENNKYYIFIEELIYGENKGFISVLEMDPQGNYSDPVSVLKENYHLSFPFIIKDNGNFYMIPESKENKRIQLYKSVDFPYKWQLEKVLMDNVRAVDTVIIPLDNKYWMFTNIVENEGASPNDELFLFWSDNLVSDNWIGHPENPIVSDVKSARMAGSLFYHNGNLYRPSQNCSKHYGYGIQLNQVLEINETSYQEKTVDSVYPEWDKKVKSTHSLSYTGNLTVIDAAYTRKK